jgi:hypothetical protein
LVGSVPRIIESISSIAQVTTDLQTIAFSLRPKFEVLVLGISGSFPTKNYYQ